jgi:Carboxypeptidase regulatory-like domain/TonB dependent receptor/TonB-dependent Receptor Plug Domain
MNEGANVTTTWMIAQHTCKSVFEIRMNCLLRMMKSFRLGALITLVISMAITGQAQTANTGALTGTVADQSGAAIPNVNIVVTNPSNGSVRTVATDSAGVYRVSLLPPGSYSVQATAAGFKEAVRSDLSIAVTEITTLNLQLSVGTNAETVTVSAQPQMVQTDSNALGRVADERTVKSLPLAARNFTQIIGLSPGVNIGLTDATQLGPGNGGMTNLTNEDLSVNGARASDNNFEMDGVPANDSIGRSTQSGGIAIPNPDSIAEFKVVTGQYDASYGHNGGANVDVITKSGTNEFHGDLFEFFRNEDLNANNYFFNKLGVPRGILRQNQFGGTIGGPILKNKLLFFGSYQGTRQSNGVTSGCSSSFVGAPLTNDRSAAALGAIYGGQHGAEGGVSIAANGSNINPVALAFLNLKLPSGGYVFPTPQQIVGGQGEYAFSTPCSYSDNQFLTNVDYVQSSRSSFSGKFFWSNGISTQQIVNAKVPGSPLTEDPQFRNLSLTHSYIFSPSILNQAEFGYHHIHVNMANASSFTFPQIGSQVIPQSQNDAFIQVGQEAAGSYENSLQETGAITVQDTLTYNRGPHSVRFGAGFTRSDITLNLRLSSIMEFLSFPDLLLGLSSAQNGSLYSNVYLSLDIPGLPGRDWLNWNTWAYVQDDIKVTPRFTANLGVRYEHIGFFADQSGRSSSFDFNLADPTPPATGSQAGYVLAANYNAAVPIPQGSIKVGNNSAIYGDNQETISPRVGFAWQVLPNSSLVVLRGGYGIYQSEYLATTALHGTTAPPFAVERELAGPSNATASLAAPFGQLLTPGDFPQFPAYTPTSLLNFGFNSPNTRPPFTQEYSLNVQSQLAHDYLLEVGYVGARGIHLIEAQYLDQANLASASNPIRGQTTNTVANLPMRLPYQGFEPNSTYRVQSTGTSWYDSAQVSLTKRFSHGLQFLASYTYGRLFDTSGGNTALVFDGMVPPGNQNDPKARYGPSPSIRPHRLVISYVYNLPKVAPSGFAAQILNNWSLSGATTFQSGHPLSIWGTNARNVYGISGTEEDLGELAPGCTRYQLKVPGAVDRKLGGFFNRSCIGSYPVVGDDGIATGFGNMKPGVINGPAQANFDVSFAKEIPMNLFGRESAWLFRAEFFNLFNTPSFGDPDINTADGASFGTISSTLGNPRIVQFALKYNF